MHRGGADCWHRGKCCQATSAQAGSERARPVAWPGPALAFPFLRGGGWLPWFPVDLFGLCFVPARLHTCGSQSCEEPVCVHCSTMFLPDLGQSPQKGLPPFSHWCAGLRGFAVSNCAHNYLLFILHCCLCCFALLLLLLLLLLLFDGYRFQLS